MEEELKQRFELWLNGCKSLNLFYKQYVSIIREMRHEEISKFKNFEEFEAKHSRGGRTGYKKYINFQIDDFSRYDPSIKLIVLKNDIRYELQIIDRDLNDITERVYGLKQNQIDGDYVALITVDDGSLKNHHMYEVDIVNNGKKYGLVCREWANLQIVNTQTKPLTEQQVNVLLGKNDVKQL
ncbi:MAG: hypothetical protein IJA72_02780 [Clostridia bacterium]|nr:hypothetical protein [Clostridia bacterium]